MKIGEYTYVRFNGGYVIFRCTQLRDDADVIAGGTIDPTHKVYYDLNEVRNVVRALNEKGSNKF